MDSLYAKIFVALVFISLCAYSLSSNAFSMDEYNYMVKARAFAQGELGPVPARMPFFPLMLAAANKLFGESIFLSKLIPILFGAIAILLTYFLAKKLFGEKTALLSALVLASNPFFAFISTRILTESLYIMLFVLCILLLYKSAKNPAFLPFLATAFGAMLLTRYDAVFFLPIPLAFLWFKKKLNTQYFKWILFSALFFLATILPWLLISYNHTGDPLGFFKEFLASQVQTGALYFSLPDKIPSFILASFFILAFFSPLLWKNIPFIWRNRKKESFSLLLATIIVMVLLLEIGGFFHPRLLRYLLVVVPFLSILASFLIFRKSTVRKLLPIISLLVLLNFASGIVLMNYFASYEKHVQYREAGIYARGCETIYSNLDLVILYYTGKQNTLCAPQCIVASDFEADPPAPLEGYRLEKDFGKVRIYKR